MNHSKSAKLRAKKRARIKEAPAGLELAPTPRRDSGKRFVNRQRQQESQDKAPDRTALQKRARDMGQPAKWRDMRQPALSEAAGKAVFLMEPSHREAARLWDVYAGLTAAHFRYCRVVLGKSPFAKTSKIEFMPERFETNPDDAGPDLRTPEETERAASYGWAVWRERVDTLRPTDYEAIMTPARNPLLPLVTEGAANERGVRLVEALRTLADISER